MERIAAAVTALVGILGLLGVGNALRFIRRRARLRAHILGEIEILKDLPQGETYEQLERHISSQVQLLLAEELPFTWREKFAMRCALGVSAFGIFLVAGWVPDVVARRLPLPSLGQFSITSGMFLFFGGLAVFSRTREKRNGRRRIMQHVAESLAEGD
jgi:hypothetical protein